MKKALFWGAAWGLTEATLGHLLHLLRIPGLAGFVMIPIGAFLMSLSVRDSGRPGAPLLASAVAAGFKFLDLLLPPADVLSVIRPAGAILAEGFVVAVLCVALSARPGILLRKGR